MRFKQETHRSQKTIFGYSVDDFVSKDHFARLINKLFDMIDTSSIEDKYSELGRPAYSPKSLLKLWFYAYANGIRSSRKLAKLLEENIAYMYLTNLERPRYRILCYFRRENEEAVAKIFAEIVHLLYKMGVISYNKSFVDGTLMKANASKRKSKQKKKIKEDIAKLEEKVKQELREYFSAVEKQDAKEDKIYGDKRGDELPPDVASKIENGKLEKLVEEAKRKIEQDKADALDRKMKKIENNYKILDEMAKREVNEINLTDDDAKLMKRGRDKAKLAYNGLVATENQFITGCLTSQDKSDDHSLLPVIEEVEEVKGGSLKPETSVVADAGFYNHNNLIGLDEKSLEGYIPEKIKNETKPFSKDKFKYLKEEDLFLCPAGEKLCFSRYVTDKRRGKGYRIYRRGDCRGCKYFGECFKGRSESREIWEDGTIELVGATRERVKSERGKSLMEKRKTEVEPVFGNIKHNMGYRYFLLRGKNGAKIEWTMMCAAHNLRKLWVMLLQRAEELEMSMKALIENLIDSRTREIIPINLLLKTLSINIQNFKEQFCQFLSKLVFQVKTRCVVKIF